MYIQRKQLEHARIELYNLTNHSNQQYKYDMYFYYHDYGTVDSIAWKNRLNYDGIKYYIIYKNANNHIRTLLYNYLNIQNPDNFTREELVSCLPNCIHPKIKDKRLNHNPFIFTFVRDPLDRFISAITEVPYPR